MEPQPAVGGDAEPDCGRVRKRRVAAAIPAGGDAEPALHRGMRGVEGGDTGPCLLPGRDKRIEAFGNADAVDLLAADGAVAVHKGVAPPDVQPVDAERQGQPVHEDFLQDRCLWHAKAAERTGRGAACVDGVGFGKVMRHAVGAGGMDRHPRRHRRSPAGIGAGVERAFEGHADEPAVGIGGKPAAHRRRMPLGRGNHRFMAGVDHPAGLSRLQYRKPQKRLQRHIELGAEAAARGGRNDPHPVQRQAEDFRRVLLVHHRRLRAGRNNQHVAVHPGASGLRLDRRMLDIGRVDCGGDGRGGAGQTVRAVAAPDPAGHQ